MKYLPLIWSAIIRSPARAILTLLSVMVAFTLFGLTIGMNASFDAIEKNAHADRLYTDPRFSNNGLPTAVAGEIGKLPGVAQVAYQSFLSGYHQDPKNFVFVAFLSSDVRKLMPDWPLTPQQWDSLEQNRTGLVISRMQAQRWKLKPGDTFTIVAPLFARADGSTTWTFQVLGIANDVPYMNEGYMMGNYDYFDKSRPAAQQGRAIDYLVQASDPSRTADVAAAIDTNFANSATPTQSITEKAAFDNSNAGLDIATAGRDIALAGMFMVLFLTANGIAESVSDRFAEFAMLKTLGFSDRAVIGLVFWEATLPCVAGALLGVGVASGISAVLPSFFPPDQGTPTLPTMTAIVFLWAGLSAAIVALASSALPALWLKKMDIATALSGRA